MASMRTRASLSEWKYFEIEHVAGTVGCTQDAMMTGLPAFETAEKYCIGRNGPNSWPTALHLQACSLPFEMGRIVIIVRKGLEFCCLTHHSRLVDEEIFRIPDGCEVQP